MFLKPKNNYLLFGARVLLSSTVYCRYAKSLVILLLILTVGGHWALLQSVAWVGMVVSYSQDAPLTVALEKTFDGHHPCQLCKAVSAGKQHEQKQALQQPVSKLEFCFDSEAMVILPPRFETPLFVYGAPMVSRTQTPPTPPPRLA